jgi:hypothetical protein
LNEDEPVRTKTIISIKHINNPKNLDVCKFSGCDTVWKNFKRAVWLYGKNQFLGFRDASTILSFSFAYIY